MIYGRTSYSIWHLIGFLMMIFIWSPVVLEFFTTYGDGFLHSHVRHHSVINGARSFLILCLLEFLFSHGVDVSAELLISAPPPYRFIIIFFFPAVICPVNICLHCVVAGMMMIMISVLGC